MRIVLASGSPRRKMILESVGLDFEVITADCEEITEQTTPEGTVEDLSRLKALAVAKLVGDALVIGADTVVAAEGIILGKPRDREDCLRMIRMISGGTHQVYTGVTLVYQGKVHTFHSATDVYVSELSEEEIQSYVNSEEPYDKAGAYAIQGYFGKYITKISGEYNNVVGFPVAAFYQECKKLGIPL